PRDSLQSRKPSFPGLAGRDQGRAPMKSLQAQAISCSVMLLGLCGCTQQASGEASPDLADTNMTATDLGSTPDTDAAGDHDILVPPHGALLGHFYGAGTLAETDARIGRKPAIHLSYYDWATDWTTDPTTASDLADGR